jgi:hypothetical protein
MLLMAPEDSVTFSRRENFKYHLDHGVTQSEESNEILWKPESNL